MVVGEVDLGRPDFLPRLAEAHGATEGQLSVLLGVLRIRGCMRAQTRRSTLTMHLLLVQLDSRNPLKSGHLALGDQISELHYLDLNLDIHHTSVVTGMGDAQGLQLL